MERSHLEARSIGDCVVARLDFRQEDDVLINCGPRYAGHDLREWLASRGINRLKTLVLTQVDSRHAGGVGQLLEQFGVGEIWIPAYESRSPVYTDLLRIARQKGIPLKRLSSSPAREISQRIAMEIFHPRKGREYRSGDQAALVFRVARADAAVLFVGSEYLPPRLFKQPRDISAPIWVLDGGRYRSEIADDILERQPRKIIVGGPPNPNLASGELIWNLNADGAFSAEL